MIVNIVSDRGDKYVTIVMKNSEHKLMKTYPETTIRIMLDRLEKFLRIEYKLKEKDNSGEQPVQT